MVSRATIHSLATAEVWRIGKALGWLKGLHVDNVIVESDVLLVVEAFHNSNPGPSSFGLIVDDSKILALYLL